VPKDVTTQQNITCENWRLDQRSLKKYQFAYNFLPHPEERRRASLLSNKSFFIYCIVLFAMAVLFRVLPSVLPGVLGYASNISVEDLLHYTNAQRESDGLKDLRLNAKLSQAAAKKAQDMFAEDYWAHVSPSGKEPWDFILGSGYDYTYAGENLAKNFATSHEVVQAWYNSPSHKENLLSPNYDEIGFAVVNGVLNGYETTLVVQMFGRPRDAKQIATVYQEAELLKEFENSKSERLGVADQKVPSSATKEISLNPQPQTSGVKIDVTKVSKAISLSMGAFILILLSLDIWYSRKKGIVKLNGHTLAHITLLVIVLLSIWFVLKPGAIF
jgi:hypothetical protein